MPHPRSLCLFALALATSAGCSSKYDAETGLVGDDSDDGDGGAGGGDGGADNNYGLPDLLSTMEDNGDCEGFDGTPVTGATVYWYGLFVGDAQQGWTGEEHWYLLANNHWEDNGGADCRVVWTFTARAADPGSCLTCDLGVVVQASVDRDRTTCDPDLWSADTSMSTTYGVFRGGGGEASWYWAESGNFMADGHYTDSGNMNYLIDAVCRWF